MESFQLHSLFFTDRQQIRLHGSTKKRTIPSETRFVFLEIGRDNKDLVGIYSSDITSSEINLMRNYYNEIKNLKLLDRIKWFQDLPSNPIIFRISQTDVENLLEWEDPNRIINRPIAIESSVLIEWK